MATPVYSPYYGSADMRPVRQVRDQEAGELHGKAYMEQYIKGSSSAMVCLRQDIAKVAAVDDAVLLLGETGTGKELVARAIHLMSGRKGKFVSVNCGAIPHDLFESEMFGFCKGSFTGATTSRHGLFEEALRGTIFLDEVDSLPVPQQAKILRVLQDKTVRRIGSGVDVCVDVRIISASNSNLSRKAAYGEFRQDLFYRLDLLRLTLAPLRHRREDIPDLAEHFCALASESVGERRVLSSESVKMLQKHDWPGNVRELENVIKRSVVMSDRKLLTPADILMELDSWQTSRVSPGVIHLPPDRTTLERLEAQILLEVMSMHHGSVVGAAQYLCLTKAQMEAKIAEIEKSTGMKLE